MSTLQTATDYAVLIYASLFILAMIFVAIGGLVLKSKLKKAKNSVKEKLNLAGSVPYIIKEIAKAVKDTKK